MASKPTRVIVEANELRRMFNEGGFWHQAQTGQLRQKVTYDGGPRPEMGEPEDTRSQVVQYLAPDGQLVAVVHQYLRGDGSLGASGRPDPKLIVVSGVTYALVEPS